MMEKSPDNCLQNTDRENASSAFPTASYAEKSLLDANHSAHSLTRPMSSLWLLLTMCLYLGKFFTEEAAPFV